METKKGLIWPMQFRAKKAMQEVFIIPYFKQYYKAIAIKTALYQHKNRHKNQWRRIEVPDMNPHSSAHLNFDKVTKPDD
jgi:hypothetical protein